MRDQTALAVRPGAQDPRLLVWLPRPREHPRSEELRECLGVVAVGLLLRLRDRLQSPRVHDLDAATCGPMIRAIASAFPVASIATRSLGRSCSANSFRTGTRASPAPAPRVDLISANAILCSRQHEHSRSSFRLVHLMRSPRAPFLTLAVADDTGARWAHSIDQALVRDSATLQRRDGLRRSTSTTARSMARKRPRLVASPPSRSRSPRVSNPTQCDGDLMQRQHEHSRTLLLKHHGSPRDTGSDAGGCGRHGCHGRQHYEHRPVHDSIAVENGSSVHLNGMLLNGDAMRRGWSTSSSMLALTEDSRRSV